MRPGSSKGKHVAFDFVDEKPVWFYMQFAIAFVFGNYRVVSVFIRDGVAFDKYGEYCFELFEIFTLFNYVLEVFLKLGFTDDFVNHSADLS